MHVKIYIIGTYSKATAVGFAGFSESLDVEHNITSARYKVLVTIWLL